MLETFFAFTATLSDTKNIFEIRPLTANWKRFKIKFWVKLKQNVRNAIEDNAPASSKDSNANLSFAQSNLVRQNFKK